MGATPPTGDSGITRRSVLRGASALALCGRPAGAGAAPTLPPEAWGAFKVRFLEPSGRVVDIEQDGISHSEGQGYGLLLAQAAGDRAAFDRIEAWTRAHLDIREDRLMAWRWTPARGGDTDQWHNATDGDLFRAWALLRAGRDSGWAPEDALAQAQAIAQDIAGACLAPDPRAPDQPLLRPGAEAVATADRVLVNPSYYMSRALRELGDHAALPALVRAADHGETVLAELAAAGPLPDWIEVTPAGFVPPQDHALRASYDALRVPLYLVWSGRGGHPAVARARRTLGAADRGGAVAVEAAPDGTVLQASDLPGYRAVLRLASCAPVAAPGPGVADQPYYPAVLQLFAAVAAREGGCDGA
ncbi:glycosyl hydrolase family 8 [Roseivivax isoporae]|nr:glycosyl hydrolase family 8 [Roseivivax isoporae]